jgi:hypothetical protein
MGLKDALGLGDEEPPLEIPADDHAQGDHEPPLDELDGSGADPGITLPPPD